jgi:hypothetical protein
MTYSVITICYAPAIYSIERRPGMEAIMFAGLAVLVVGGYYSMCDFMSDMGIGRRVVAARARKLPVTRGYLLTPQPGVKKMAGMHI